MIGMTTKLAALELLRKRLLSSPDASLQGLGHLIDNQPEFCRMGALGTTLGDFAPVRLPANAPLGSSGANPYVELWKLIFNVFGGDGTTANPGLKPVLDKIRTLLDKLDAIAAAEDLDALKAMSGEVDTLNQIASDLNAILVAIKGDGTLANLGIVPRVVDLIGAHAQPAMVRPRVGGGSASRRASGPCATFCPSGAPGDSPASCGTRRWPAVTNASGRMRWAGCRAGR